MQKLLGKKKGFKEFAEDLGKRESGGDYTIVNSLGFMGKYQFGMARLSDLGYTERKAGTTGFDNNAFAWKTGYSQEHFLNTPEFQDRVFREHVKNLVSSIKRSYSSSFGQKVYGITFTLSGAVAGAHLGGLGGVSKFLELSIAKDAYGTSVADYIEQFGGYNIEKGLT